MSHATRLASSRLSNKCCNTRSEPDTPTSTISFLPALIRTALPALGLRTPSIPASKCTRDSSSHDLVQLSTRFQQIHIRSWTRFHVDRGCPHCQVFAAVWVRRRRWDPVPGWIHFKHVRHGGGKVSGSAGGEADRAGQSTNAGGVHVGGCKLMKCLKYYFQKFQYSRTCFKFHGFKFAI